jgi:hypothetical protein
VVELLPDLLHAVATVETRVVEAFDLDLHGRVAHVERTRWTGLGGVVGAGGELQDSADRFDSPSIPSGIDVAHYLLV